MKNKNEPKVQYIFGENEENKAGFTLTGLKNLIMDTTELKEEKMKSKDLDEIREMKDTLYEFSTTNTGICNALIFLGEKNNINDEYEYYHFNPWKAEWIYTNEYKKKRKEMIRKIRSSMDYRGEISDDEDSIIKYDETQDQFNDLVRQFNRRSIAMEAKPNAINEEKPMIDNKELIKYINYLMDLD